jgi:2-dehydro-3-deoxygluconokinase
LWPADRARATSIFAQPRSSKGLVSDKPFDLITWGETMVRFSPPAGFSLEGAPVMEVWTGGTESNVAIALARLGRRVSWVSRLPDNPLGRRVAREIAAHGVDTAGVVWASGDRMGLNFIETGPLPRSNVVVYDRARSAIANLRPGELDFGFLASGKMLHLTGITPALSPTCREAWLESARRAKAAGCQVVLDINYRAKLWSTRRAREVLETVFPHVSLVLGALRDAQQLFGMPRDPELAVESFTAAYHLPLVVLTNGAQGALAHDGKTVHHHPAFRTEIVDRIGAGDAFAAGFIYGWKEKDVAYGLRCGNAMGALQQTYRGDATWSTKEELLELVEAGEADPRHVKR